jgi:hypothetical protein
MPARLQPSLPPRTQDCAPVLCTACTLDSRGAGSSRAPLLPDLRCRAFLCARFCAAGQGRRQCLVRREGGRHGGRGEEYSGSPAPRRRPCSTALVSGIAGLSAMPAQRRGRLLRPCQQLEQEKVKYRRGPSDRSNSACKGSHAARLGESNHDTVRAQLRESGSRAHRSVGRCGAAAAMRASHRDRALRAKRSFLECQNVK